MDFNKFADSIMKYIGGKENVSGLTHCATRLRFTLKDESKANEEEIKKVSGVLGIARSGGQFQIIVGNQVPKAYAAISNKYMFETSESDGSSVKQKPIEKLFDFISSIFTPVLPAIIGAGLIKSILALAVLLGMNDKSTTYQFINIIGDAPLYFLPIMLAVTASKKLGCNQFLAIAITGALLHPSYTSLITDAFNLHFTSMFGLPVALASYNSSVIPVILMVIALHYVDKVLDKVIPNIVKFFFKPLLTMLIVATLTFVVLGPIGFMSGIAISTGLNYLSEYAGWLVPTIIGAIFPLMVTTGMHYGIVPFMLQSISAQGFEQICCPGNLPSNIAQGAASLAVGLKTKKTDLKQMSFTSGVTALLGVTEPALFGVTLKYKRVLVSVMAGGACGGFYAGITGVKCFSFCSPGLLSLVAFVGPDGWANITNACISMVIGFVVTFVMVWIWGYKEEEQASNQSIDSINLNKNSGNVKNSITSPVKGNVITLSEVNDSVFSQEVMGKGFAVIPEESTITSPVNGTVVALFPTKHAIGLKSEAGEEILIHVGIDTVNLEGKYIESVVNIGDSVKQGDILLQVDFDSIKKEGYDITTMVIITNTADYNNVKLKATGKMNINTEVLSVE